MAVFLLHVSDNSLAAYECQCELIIASTSIGYSRVNAVCAQSE